MPKAKQKPKRVLIWRKAGGTIRLLTSEQVTPKTLANAKLANVEIVGKADVPKLHIERFYKDVQEAADVAQRELKLQIMSTQELAAQRLHW